MEDLLKDAFPLYGKVASTSKNPKIAENIEKTGAQLHKQQIEKLVSTGRNQLGEKYIPVEE